MLDSNPSNMTSCPEKECDYYTDLGVTPQEGQEEIRQAYEVLSPPFLSQYSLTPLTLSSRRRQSSNQVLQPFPRRPFRRRTSNNRTRLGRLGRRRKAQEVRREKRYHEAILRSLLIRLRAFNRNRQKTFGAQVSKQGSLRYGWREG